MKTIKEVNNQNHKKTFHLFDITVKAIKYNND